MNNELQKQWEQDVKDYGDNAYLLWEYESFGIVSHFDFGATPDLLPHPRRKESAALPFDLKRAKAGDVVEYKDWRGKWLDSPDPKEWYNQWETQDQMKCVDHFRMKYPQKISVTEETKYCTYPDCHCPFDALSDDWCLYKLPKKLKENNE